MPTEINMTPEQKRVAIARACGWTVRASQAYGGWVVELYGKVKASFWFLFGHERDCTLADCISYLPSYLDDLDAMHEAEKVLDLDKGRPLPEVYAQNLYKVIDAKSGGLLAEFEDDPVRVAAILLRAEASERADALILTLGLTP